ncbi:DNA repair protein RadA [Pseudothermotoga thermarum]|uniref:DNA repair protein RadA n=1 Tax=Pseudothermotoga thermarum DSM 5069 TaxID=688269 RepID=F7YXS3_9THEM|nr:DNA repair protein RadA [Pseudothermotoga thermarum]AEH50717.1 DNA repair protein RadA [Pseudothermotoga thermarum DSM 5069]
MKEKSSFVCSNCGYKSPKWFGKCPQCGLWDTAVEQMENSSKPKIRETKVLSLEEIAKTSNVSRSSTGFSELDTALGGGLIPGQVLLLGGEPGVGKSTLALQICNFFSSLGKKVLYITAEESPEQVALRAQRLGAKNIGKVMITAENDPDVVLQLVDSSFSLLVIDSLQTMYSPELGLYAGSVAQVRYTVERTIERCKTFGVPAILIAHVTKSGEIAGPKLIEHLVDTVVYFEGEQLTELRILRTVKNRFGPSGEIAVFEMTENGLKQLETFGFFDRVEQLSGNSLSCVIEGSRAFVVQVQALVSKTRSSVPKRISSGYDLTRLYLIIAVVSKQLNFPFEWHDVYVNVLGGLRITDTAVDAAVAGALISSYLDIPIGDVALLGELSLDGRIKSVSRLQTRIEALKKIGIEKILSPTSFNLKGNIIEIKTVKDLGKIIGGVQI